MSQRSGLGNRAKVDSGRVKGNFLALPHDVLKSPSFRKLSYSSRALLTDIAMQSTASNNGKLVACLKYLSPLGWTSKATIGKATKDLLDAGLLIETRKGCKPNKASWFALPWRDLNVTIGLDIDPKQYKRGTTYEIAIYAPKTGVRK
jgi:hypothetical protein